MQKQQNSKRIMETNFNEFIFIELYDSQIDWVLPCSQSWEFPASFCCVIIRWKVNFLWPAIFQMRIYYYLLCQLSTTCSNGTEVAQFTYPSCSRPQPPADNRLRGVDPIDWLLPPTFFQSSTSPTNHIWSYKYKIYMGIPCKPYGDTTLITHRDLQKVYTLNKYCFPIFIYYKETLKKLVTHIN